MVVTLILLRWLTVSVTPATLGPSYWILMGATAISVLAGAVGLALPAGIPVVRATAGFVEGFTFALWAFRHLVDPAACHPGPVAAPAPPLAAHLRAQPVEHRLSPRHVQRGHADLREAARLAFMEPLARFMLWVAVAAWALVAAAFLAGLARHPEESASGPSALSSGTAATHGTEKKMP